MILFSLNNKMEHRKLFLPHTNKYVRKKIRVKGNFRTHQ